MSVKSSFAAGVLSLLCLVSLARGQSYVCGYTETYANSNMAVALKLDYDNSTVYITMTGTVDQYFAVGFGSNMPNTYAIIVDDSGVTERKLGPTNSGSGAGTLLDATVSVESNTTDGSVRTVVVSRALDGQSADYFDFGQYTSGSSISIIWATDTTSASFEQHSNRGYGTIDFVENADADDVECDLTDESTTVEPTTSEATTYICGTVETRSADDMAVFLRIDEDNEMVYITMTGPDDQWFGAGFGSSTMSGTYVIIVDNGGVSERELAARGSGTELEASVTTLSDTSSGGVRTVLLSRDLAGDSDSYYTFGTSGSISMIYGTTSGSASFTQHSNKGSTSLSLASGYAADSSVCGADPTTTSTDDDDDGDDDDSAMSLAGKVAFVCVLSGLFALNL